MAQHVLTAGQVGAVEAADLDEDQEAPQGGNHDGEKSEEEVGEGQEGQSEQPEPQQQVDLELISLVIKSQRKQSI